MKPLLILFLPVLLLLNQHLYAQLSDQQKQERCENNRKRLAELEGQLQAVNIKLLNMPEKKQIEDERNDLAEVRKIGAFLTKINKLPDDSLRSRKDEDSIDYFDKVERRLAKYNAHCLSIDIVKCTYLLVDVIGKKIDKEVKLLPERPHLLQTKSDLEKQIAFHKNNLAALDCDRYNIAFAGKWTYHDNSSGYTVEQSFDTNGNGHADVTCTYTLEANQIVLHWSNGWTNFYPLPVTNTMSGTAVGPNGERHNITLTRH